MYNKIIWALVPVRDENMVLDVATSVPAMKVMEHKLGTTTKIKVITDQDKIRMAMDMLARMGRR